MSNVNSVNNLTGKELIDCLVKNLHYNSKWEYCLLQFPKRKTYTINFGFPSHNKSCTHVLIGHDGISNYEDVAFVDLENNVASTYYISQSFLKALYDGDFFNDRDYFSISTAKNDQEVVFIENIILRQQ